MIKPVQQNERLQVPSSKNFKSSDKKENTQKEKAANPELMAAQYKYGLACLYAASARLENEKLKQELANATAQVNYRKAC